MSPCAACLRARRRLLLWLAGSLLLLPALAGDPPAEKAAAPATDATSVAAAPDAASTVTTPPAAATTTIVTTTITTKAEPATAPATAVPATAAPAEPAQGAASATAVEAATPAAVADTPTPAATPTAPATTAPASDPDVATAAKEPAATVPVVETPQTETSSSKPVPPADSGQPSVSTPMALDADLLLLDDTARRLPSVRVGRAYHQRFHARGGVPPYFGYRLIEGTLPTGIAVTDDGALAGTATTTGRWRFRVQVSDSAGQHAQQSYVLHVLRPPRPRPARPKPAPPPAVAPAVSSQLVNVPTNASPVPPGPTITVYALTDKIIGMIEATAVTPEPEAVAAAAAGASPADVGAAAGAAAGAVAGAAAGAAAAQAATVPAATPTPTATAPGAPVTVAADPDALPPGMSKAGAAQLQLALEPLAGVEFPERELFLSALDQRLCDYAQQVAQSAASQQNVAAPTPDQWRDLCPHAWKDVTPAVLDGPLAQVPWQALPATLMPPAWRDWLVVRAGSVQPIAPPDALQWTGTGCNCLVPSTSGLIFGLLPGWHDPKLTAPVDFLLYDRLIAFALPFADDGTLLPNPPAPTATQQEFIRTTHRYGSQIDAAIYRDDWTFLTGLTGEQSAQLAQRLARNAVARINTPLSQFTRHWYDRVPGLAPDDYLADGVVLYLRGPAPGTTGFGNYERFREELVQSLIRGLRSLPRETALSIVVDGPELMANANIDNPRGWSVQRLLDYLEAAATLAPGESGYARTVDDDPDDARLRLQYLVLMPEPGAENLRRLRAAVDNADGLTTRTRRQILSRLQPLVSVGSRHNEAMLDDLNYIVANFGGVTLWPQVQADPAMTSQLQRMLRQTLMAGAPDENRLCAPVCEWRWPLRAGFFALAFVTTIALVAWLAVCRLRRVHRLTWGLVAGGLLSLAVGGLLLQCDPGLVELRESNVLLFVLVAAIVIALLIALLRPKVEAP